ncbi:MAG: hypothetical protein QM733_01435 [Ilumatobacteraceae bacterium]
MEDDVEGVMAAGVPGADAMAHRRRRPAAGAGDRAAIGMSASSPIRQRTPPKWSTWEWA